MEIKSIKFIKSVTGTDPIFEDGIPQVAFIGRSNVGKSSVINSLVGGGFARTSNTPGFTRQINFFLINQSVYLVDLPGYGYAKVGPKMKGKISEMINWYFFVSEYEQKKVILIIDADVGPTQIDLETLYGLEDKGKNIVIIANKVDKIKKADYEKKLENIKDLMSPYKIIPYSAKKKIGREELLKEVLSAGD